MPNPISIDAINALLDSAPTTASSAPPQTVETTENDPQQLALVDTELSADIDAELDAELDADIQAELLAEATAESRDIVDGENYFNPVLADGSETKNIDTIYDDVTAELALDSEDDTPEPMVETSSKKRTTIPKAPISELATDETLEAMSASRDTIDECVAATPLQVQRKVKNMIMFLQNNADLSVYTAITLTELIKEKVANKSDFCYAMMNYKPRPYSFKTANTQAADMVALLPLMGITERKGNAQHLIMSSPFVQAFLKTPEYISASDD